MATAFGSAAYNRAAEYKAVCRLQMRQLCLRIAPSATPLEGCKVCMRRFDPDSRVYNINKVRNTNKVRKNEVLLKVTLPGSYTFMRRIQGFLLAIFLAPLAVWATSSFYAFKSIPWTLSYLVVAIVADVGGFVPVLLACLIEAAGVYHLILAPGQTHLYDRTAWIQTAAFLSIATLITYLVRQKTLAMSSLQASELHYRSVTETAPDVVITIDEESRILSINPSVRTVFGYEPHELIGRDMVELMPERLRASHLAGIARHLSTGKRHIPWTGIQLPGLRKDGKEISLEISFAAFTLGSAKRFTGFIRDISERQKTLAALIKSEKLAVVGRLASSIAHEINNPLESVMNLLYLSRQATDVAEIKSYLETGEEELSRVAAIANQTLQFHRHSHTLAPVKCDVLIEGSLALYKGRLANTNISIEHRMRALRTGNFIEGEIRQVLNNLVGNAIDAMPRGGRIFARSRDATDWASGKTGVVLTIADTGPGIEPGVLTRMFEPFYSTKGNGGAGLGLWICEQLIARNGGRLQVRSIRRHTVSGTVFALFLPDKSNLPGE